MQFLKALLEQYNEFTTSLKADLKLKDGSIFTKGTKVSCRFPEDSTTIFLIIIDGREIKLKYTSAAAYLNKFKPAPSIRSLEKMSNDGIATTPLGARTEQDGHGIYGEPSWFLVLGFM